MKKNWTYPEGYKTLVLVRGLGNFCFYGLKSILVLYLTFQFLLTDQKTFSLYGTFMALAYLTPILGGWISDRFFGLHKSILLGGWIVFIGCLLLSLSHEGLSYLGLTLVSMGNGFFKPNAMSAVGALFPDRESKMRDSAYTILYAAMNLGNLLGPLVCGWVGHRYGWSFAFPLLGGVILGASFLFHFHFKNNKLFSVTKAQKERGISQALGIFVFALAALFFLLFYSEHVTWLMPIIILGSLGCLGLLFFKTEGQEQKNILKISLLMALFAIFASLFEQTGSSLTLFIERGVNRVLFEGVELPSPFFQSLNPVLVIGLGPLVAGFWGKLDHQGHSVSIFGKYALGFLFVGFSFALLSLGLQVSSETLLSPIWIVALFILQVVGELCIVPIGFSAVSKLAPQKFMTMIMGLWMVSISCGHYVAAFLAALAPLPSPNVVEKDDLFFEGYSSFFLKISFIPFSVSFLIVGILLYRRLQSPRKI